MLRQTLQLFMKFWKAGTKVMENGAASGCSEHFVQISCQLTRTAVTLKVTAY